MITLKARSIDILVAVLAVAFVLAGRFDLIGPTVTWTVLALLVVYLGWFLKRRSPYRTSAPADLHLKS